MKKAVMITLKEDGKESAFIYIQKPKFDKNAEPTKWAKDIYKKDVVRNQQK